MVSLSLPVLVPPGSTAGFSLADVTVRLCGFPERPAWDAMMNRHHPLGFRRFVGHGLRYVVEWRGHWVALSGWGEAAWKSRHRDALIGWQGDQKWTRLHLISNNIRYVILGGRGQFPRLGSHVLGRITRRLSDDWQRVYGHPILMVETFVDPKSFDGTIYAAANWKDLGETRGYVRHHGSYIRARPKVTSAAGKESEEAAAEPAKPAKKRYWVRRLRRDAWRRLRAPGELPDALQKNRGGACTITDLKSLYALFHEVEDARRAQGRKHHPATVLSTIIAAKLADHHGPIAAAKFAKMMTQDQLRAVGAWQRPGTGRYEPPAKSTIHRLMPTIDPGQTEEVVQAYRQDRQAAIRELSVDAKRIPGASCNRGGHDVAVILAGHETGEPVALHSDRDGGGEIAATRTLLSQVEINGTVITLDALPATCETAEALRSAGADYVLIVRGNAPDMVRALAAIDWETDAPSCKGSKPKPNRGRLDERSIHTQEPSAGTFTWPGVRQVFRVTRHRTDARSRSARRDERTTTESYGITSLSPAAATPERLLTLVRRHGAVKVQHNLRDVSRLEDFSRLRTGHSPPNNAPCNALALVIRKTGTMKELASAVRAYGANWDSAFEEILRP